MSLFCLWVWLLLFLWSFVFVFGILVLLPQLPNPYKQWWRQLSLLYSGVQSYGLTPGPWVHLCLYFSFICQKKQMVYSPQCHRLWLLRTEITTEAKEQSSIQRYSLEQNNVLHQKGIVLSDSIKLQRKTPAEGRKRRNGVQL